MKNKSKRGGKRIGSGRKPGKRQQYVTRLLPDTVEWIKSQSVIQDCSECDVVEKALLKEKRAPQVPLA